MMQTTSQPVLSPDQLVNLPPEYALAFIIGGALVHRIAHVVSRRLRMISVALGRILSLN